MIRGRAVLSRTAPLGVAGGINLYQFNGNNPATFTDPFGLCPEIPQLCVAGVVAIGKAVSAAVRSPTGQRAIQRGSELARNLAQSGAVRQAGEAAHHIVAKAAQAAQPARDKLAEVGININDAVNGVILPAIRVTLPPMWGRSASEARPSNVPFPENYRAAHSSGIRRARPHAFAPCCTPAASHHPAAGPR